MKDKFSLEAKLYDKIWGKYNYDSDVQFLHGLFRDYDCRKVIDIGCGTGGHALRLSRRGYEVTGVDVSPAMLKIARKKNKETKVKFVEGDMRKLNKVIQKDEKFDAAVCLGQTFSHLITNRDVRMFLNGLHNILRKRGLFVFNARNAKKISEEKLNKLILDHVIIEEKLQVLLLAYNSRSPRDRNVIIWRPIYLIKENDKVDLQIGEHKLRRFYFSLLKRMLIEEGFEVVATYSGNTKEEFREEEHETMWFVTTAR